MNDGLYEEPVAKRRWTFWRVVFVGFMYLWATLFLAAFVAGLGAFMVYDHVTQPGMRGETIELTIPAGVTGQQVGEILVSKGLIEYAGFFRLAIRFEGPEQPIRYGVYELARGSSPTELLRALYAGPLRTLLANQVKITFPEGLSVAQMAERLSDPEAFIEAAHARDLIARLGVAVETLEGFLMPNTYFFDAPPTERFVVERMLAQFEKGYAELTTEIPGADAYDTLSVVTIASLVEEEARDDAERALVAAVLYNRLDKGMLLQMDSTLQYALGKYGQRILNEDKEVDSLYNTYKHLGLPPGPISNPGTASLRAALDPAEVDYLYFVSNADGKTHTFSRTAQEHEKMVTRYRREITQQRRAPQ